MEHRTINDVALKNSKLDLTSEFVKSKLFLEYIKQDESIINSEDVALLTKMRKSSTRKFVLKYFKCHEISHKAMGCSGKVDKPFRKPKNKENINWCLLSVMDIKKI